jgi:hypothetical protein
MADRRSTFGAMPFKAVDTCYAINVTGAGEGGSDLKSLKIKTSKEGDSQLMQKTERRPVLPG